MVDNLGISTGTLRSYIPNIFEKLHFHCRRETVVKIPNSSAVFLG
ncbi:response regulator receiver protein [Pedosphaera parvula Ellin514]|uniref:Response regulator receiver protein n=1 Tax=Pedosphaera parvula (strain Ellin514) TaxID=320771 RepID=B9XAG3_PEDPL|nr:response regulator receiver protein [Pedosphaera parvula Ellin514]